MAFDWSEYLTLAQHLQTQGYSGFSQEAAFRCAVSRAYYAAFCHARNYARDRQGFAPTYTAQDHELVRNHFRRRGNIHVASSLDQLRQWRNQCDYDDSVANLPLMVVGAILRAQEIIGGLT
jgi:hypothetical protein